MVWGYEKRYNDALTSTGNCWSLLQSLRLFDLSCFVLSFRSKVYSVLCPFACSEESGHFQRHSRSTRMRRRSVFTRIIALTRPEGLARAFQEDTVGPCWEWLPYLEPSRYQYPSDHKVVPTCLVGVLLDVRNSSLLAGCPSQHESPTIMSMERAY